MKQRKTPELTQQDMAAARLLLDEKKTVVDVERETGIGRRTLFRRMKTPQFVEYQERIRAEEDKKLQAKTDAVLENISFDKPALVKVLADIVRAPATATNNRYVDQVNAGRLLVDMLGWMPKPGDTPSTSTPDPDALPKAKFYRSEWMDEKPN